jgi:hypothetical protein
MPQAHEEGGAEVPQEEPFQPRTPLLEAGAPPAPELLPRSNSVKLRLPGFSDNPIRFNAEYWKTRRLLRLLWAFVIIAVLGTLTGARPQLRAGPTRVGPWARTKEHCDARRALSFAALAVIVSGRDAKEFRTHHMEPSVTAFLLGSVFTVLTGARTRRARGCDRGVLGRPTGPGGSSTCQRTPPRGAESRRRCVSLRACSANCHLRHPHAPA